MDAIESNIRTTDTDFQENLKHMKSLTAEELVDEVKRRIQSCHAVARSSQRHADK